jgi:hypothetical protein
MALKKYKLLGKSKHGDKLANANAATYGKAVQA